MASDYKFNIFFLVLLLHLAIGLTSQGEAAQNYSSIGLCYDAIGLVRSAEEGVYVYKSYGIHKMRLYYADVKILDAVRHSEIQVLLGLHYFEVKPIAKSYHASRLWIEQNIMVYWPDVQFRYIAVGNESFMFKPKQVLKAMKNLHKVLTEVGLERHIKISAVVGTSVVDIVHPPSAASFNKKDNLFMAPLLHFLDNIGSPLLVNVFPYSAFKTDPKIPLDFALFASDKVVIQDGDFKYTNLFDMILDALRVAIERTRANTSIVISGTGWPHDGYRPHSSIDHASTYNSNLIRHVLSSYGTPMHREDGIEIYLFSTWGFDKKLFTGAN